MDAQSADSDLQKAPLRWLGWLESRRAQGLAVDATHAEDDRWPGWASRGHEVYRALRHPRSFLLTMVLDP